MPSIQVRVGWSSPPPPPQGSPFLPVHSKSETGGYNKNKNNKSVTVMTMPWPLMEQIWGGGGGGGGKVWCSTPFIKSLRWDLERIWEHGYTKVSSYEEAVNYE